MKIKDIITEIGRLDAEEFEGGKEYLQGEGVPKGIKWQVLPGGSGLKWGIEKRNDSTNVLIVDATPSAPNPNLRFVEPKRERWMYNSDYEDIVSRKAAEWEEEKRGGGVQLIGRLTLSKYNGPIKNAYEVHTITVDEDRRGIGIAKALYGIVLSLMKATLVSGNSQTPGGRRNWLSLASIPGVEVKGLLIIPDYEFGQKKKVKTMGRQSELEQEREQNAAQEKIELLMQLVFQYVGKMQRRFDGIEHYFAFDVTGSNGELAPAVTNKLSQIYGNDTYGTLLYARWNGQ